MRDTTGTKLILQGKIDNPFARLVVIARRPEGPTRQSRKNLDFGLSHSLVLKQRLTDSTSITFARNDELCNGILEGGRRASVTRPPDGVYNPVRRVRAVLSKEREVSFATAGMNGSGRSYKLRPAIGAVLQPRHPREGGDPNVSQTWISAFAGMARSERHSRPLDGVTNAARMVHTVVSREPGISSVNAAQNIAGGG